MDNLKVTSNKEILEYHKGEKIGTAVKKELKNSEDLSIIYTPGVAVPALEIEKNPELAYDYTNKRNSVAVITNGTAVLGLGNIGVLGAKPIMEGKCVLFKKFANVDAVDVLVDSQNPKEFIDVVKKISKTYGGINLEDIKAPECFWIEQELKKSLDIPVFHDDQHGTAIVSSVALLNALKVNDKKINEIKVVVVGAGAAGISCAKLFLKLGVKKNNLMMFDSKGMISKNRKDINEFKKKFAVEQDVSLKNVTKNSDVFLGTSTANILTAEMLSSMNKDPIVFAMANPVPEIDYKLAKKTREDVILATGRSDHPNQVNNILAFPFVFRGALDVRAKEINEEMKIAAVNAIAKIAKEDEKFGKEHIIPEIWNKKLFLEVSFAVAKSAIETGVARKKINLEKYKKSLRL